MDVRSYVMGCSKCPIYEVIGGGKPRGVHSLLYFGYTCGWDLFIGGVIVLAKKIIRLWYFTCKHVSLF
jgi:hypothetical protein